MGWRASMVLVLVSVPACADENPLYGYGVLESSDGENQPDAGDDDDDDDDNDAADDDDDDDDDDDGAEVCMGAAPGEFELNLDLSPAACSGVVRWRCELDHDVEWILRACCEGDPPCDDPLPDIAFELTTPGPGPSFEGAEVMFHALLNGSDDWCIAEWVEITSGVAPLPLYAAAGTVSPGFDSLSVGYDEPEGADRCACSENDATCCDRPAGPYDLVFNLPDFADMFPGVVLGQAEVWDSPIGDWGHPLIEVFSAFRDSGCQRDLKVDWYFALQENG